MECKEGIGPSQLALQASSQPLRLTHDLVGDSRFELLTSDVSDRHSTSELIAYILAHLRGFEPLTHGLEVHCSAIGIQEHMCSFCEELLTPRLI